MSNDLFADDRIQFYLRNQDDIKTWAAIESDVMAATRELLGGAQVALEERLVPADQTARIGRHDSGQWERVLVRRDGWPNSVGLTLEWNRSVDPAGGSRPKIGVFWWADPATLVEPRTRLVQTVAGAELQALGYKVPLEGVWPVGARTPIERDWWRDPDRWLSGIVDRLVATWPLVAPAIDDVLVGVSWK